MSRISVLVIPLVAIAWTGQLPAQDRQQVIEAVQKLESRLDAIDRYFSGLQSSESGAMQSQIASMQQALAETREEVATQLGDARAAQKRAEQALVAVTGERDAAQQSLALLRGQLQESDLRTRKVEADLEGLQARFTETVTTLEARAQAAEDETARLTEELATAILEDQAGEREREVLAQRADDAEASLAVEQEKVAELENQLQENPPGNPAATQTVLQVPSNGGIQIYVQGGEAIFHINGSAVPGIQVPATNAPAELHLKLRPDGTPERTPPAPRIHLP